MRREAAEAFDRGEDNAAIARRLRVHVRSVQRWRQSWVAGGPHALASKGAVSVPLLSSEEFVELEQELAKGAMAHGWPDPHWTLERIRMLIRSRFGAEYSVQGVAGLLKRHGWSRRPMRRRVSVDGTTVGWAKG